jgi:hypothetical protein
MNNCENCKWWEQVGKEDGNCMRFPKWVITHKFHWCGEFEQKLKLEKEQENGTM